ncbi:MAG: DUF333 domain-containing protein [Proteobacteria bacterium]|nr:DUF333 domain-containing protein [Pseudomonadota bacterium]
MHFGCRCSVTAGAAFEDIRPCVRRLLIAGGQYDMCRLPDGKICEKWTLYRDKVCQPGT